MEVTSYRESHKSPEVAAQYDHWFVNRVDSLVWDGFVKPWLHNALQDAKARGATRYLDFACGTGRILSQGARYFAVPTGIDVSGEMLARAARRVPEAKLHCIDVTREESGHLGPYDCVTLFRFIRNAEPELRHQVLDWIWRHTTDGAVLVLNNHGHSASISGLVQRLAFWLPAEKRNRLSRRETYALLESAGFQVMECRGFQIMPSLFGRPILGRRLQTAVERILVKLGFGKFGYELVIVARRSGQRPVPPVLPGDRSDRLMVHRGNDRAVP